MHAIEVTRIENEQREAALELADQECDSAREALTVASTAHKQAIVLMDHKKRDLAEGWARIAREAASTAWGHATAATGAAAHSRSAAAAREHANAAHGYAYSAEQYTRRD